MFTVNAKQDLDLLSPDRMTPKIVNIDNLITDEFCNEVWKTVEARHFILNFLLVILWSSALRPINSDYESWFFSRVRFADRMLKRLSEPGWELAEPTVEEGISKIAPIVEQSLKGRSGNISDTIDILSHYHFKRYDRSWSSLRPAKKSFSDEWSSPSKLFFAFGPHIGIGDEMILFLAVEAFMRKFPHASVEVWSHSKDLWRWNHRTDVHHIDSDALEPFIRAQEVLKETPDAFIAFCDFASDKIYRELETVPGFERFFYIDIGSRLVRLVNQSEGCISEYHCGNECSTIYDAVNQLLTVIGVETPKLGSLIPSLKDEKDRANFRVFLNPHSSKEKSAVSAQWWADAVQHLSENSLIELNIVSGINEANYQFAQSIAQLLDTTRINAKVLPKSGLDKIIKSALSHDIIIGLDTFTAHMNIISKVNCVTVFFGSSGDSWRVPQSNVLNLQITDQPTLAGELAKLLLCPVSDDITSWTLRKISHVTQLLDQSLGHSVSCGFVNNCLDDILEYTKSLFVHDRTIASTFFDYPMSHIESLKGVVKTVGEDESISELQSRILRAALMGWKNSNLSRYSSYIASQPSLQVA